MDLTNINLRHLRAAAAIAKLGSVSAAASALHISQPAITQGLAKMERQIGHPLFERRAGGMKTTEAGTIFISRIDAAFTYIASGRVTMTQLRAMIALADAGSYVGASAATGLAQPSLHRAIGDLSVVLKKKLVERRGKGTALTDKGKQLARNFRLARAELQAGLNELSALSGREVSHINIGAMPLSRARILPSATIAFHRQHPNVSINIIEGAFHELIEPLRDGEIDMMIGALRHPSPGPDVIQQSLFDDHPVVIGRTDHPVIRAGADLEKLAQYPWILPASGAPLRRGWAQMFESLSIPPPNVPIECGSVITIRQILISSDFLTLLSPDQIAVELEAGWLVKIANAPDGLTRDIGVTTREGWRPTPMQEKFMQHLKHASN